MKEDWITFDTNRYNNSDKIVAVSNLGRIKRLNGKVEESKYRTRICGKRIYHIIADNFLVTCRSKDQIFVDHITHKPVGMNINDVRNLRWCTQAENVRFAEHCENLSNSKKGKPTWNKGMSGAEYLKHYKDGVKNQFTSTKVG